MIGSILHFNAGALSAMSATSMCFGQRCKRNNPGTNYTTTKQHFNSLMPRALLSHQSQEIVNVLSVPNLSEPEQSDPKSIAAPRRQQHQSCLERARQCAVCSHPGAYRPTVLPLLVLFDYTSPDISRFALHLYQQQEHKQTPISPKLTHSLPNHIPPGSGQRPPATKTRA
jgi:hypothetical protein